METEIYASLFEMFVKYLIPVLAVNFMTDVFSRFVPQEKQYYIMPIVCMLFAFLVGFLYGYIEEENFRDTVYHTLVILTISGFLYTTHAYKAIKNRVVRIIKKDKENNL